MKFGSVCSGIEAASVAWEPLGWKAAWFSEIEPFPCEVLKHHYPDVPNLGDMTALPQRIISGEIEAPDLFCGGTPCQAFSVAGLRKSLDDARGNLSLTFCEIANAIDNVRLAGGEHPAIIFWENVPGVLSTKDNAFGCFLAGLAGEDGAVEPPGGKWTNAGCVYGPQRAVAWRVLDAQYFGVAQRRKRVFVVASARDDFDPAAVLFEFDGVRRDTAPSREAGKESAASTGFSVTGSVTGGFGPKLGTDESCQGSVIPQPYLVGNTLTARMHKGMNSTLDEGQTPVIAWDEELNASIEQAGTLLRGGSGGRHDGVMQPMAWSIMPQNSGKDYKARQVDVAQPLMAAGPVGGNQGGDFITQPVAFHPTQDPISSTDISHAIGTGSGRGCATAAVAFDSLNQSVSRDGTTHTLRVGRASDELPMTLTAMQVRRLTPIECERLQGFPDGYTAIQWRKKPISECPDGPRYKALGNSWAVPVVRWIGKRIETEIKCKPNK